MEVVKASSALMTLNAWKSRSTKGIPSSCASSATVWRLIRGECFRVVEKRWSLFPNQEIGTTVSVTLPSKSRRRAAPLGSVTWASLSAR